MKKNKPEKGIRELYSPERIDYSLGVAKDLIPEYARNPLAEALSFLPENVIDFVTEKIIFISILDNVDGLYYPFNHPFFKNRVGFILFPNNLWERSIIEVAFTVAHEIAHAFKEWDIQSWEDLENTKRSFKNEKAADKLAVEWLSKNFPKKKLLK